MKPIIFKCPYCNFTFPTEQKAINHIILNHLTPENVYKFASFLLTSSNGKERIKYKIEAEICP